jgi:hypothetical protein
MFLGYTQDHASNVYVFSNLKNQASFMSQNVVWLHKLFHQHMTTKSALIPGISIFDVSHAITNAQPVPPAIAPTIAPAPITPRLKRTTAPRIVTPPSIYASDDTDDDDDDVHDPTPTPHAPLTPRLTRELRNLDTFYNPKQGDKSNVALLTHDNHTCADELLAFPYNNPGADLEIISNNVEFCNAHLPEYDNNPQSADQALLGKKSKHWWKAMISEST